MSTAVVTAEAVVGCQPDAACACVVGSDGAWYSADALGWRSRGVAEQPIAAGEARALEWGLAAEAVHAADASSHEARLSPAISRLMRHRLAGVIIVKTGTVRSADVYPYWMHESPYCKFFNV